MTFSLISQAEVNEQSNDPMGISTSCFVDSYWIKASHDQGIQQLDVIVEVEITVATNDYDIPCFLIENSEWEMDVIRDK